MPGFRFKTMKQKNAGSYLIHSLECSSFEQDLSGGLNEVCVLRRSV